MKLEFIKRGAATRLILIFAGWSTDARYYSDCVADGWDTAVVSDYRDLTVPSIPDQYSTVYIFAYSLGVAAASMCDIRAAVRIAICGSMYPVSDSYGIPETIYSGTLEGLDERSLKKFHLRMAGDKATYESIKERLPENPDIPCLRDELVSIRDNFHIPGKSNTDNRFFRVYLAQSDRIFPYDNLSAFWKEYAVAEIVSLRAPHAVDMASIVKDCLPDTKAIGDGFSRAGKTYNNSAVVQEEICRKIGDIIVSTQRKGNIKVDSVLEIGVGQGLLTEVWGRLLSPSEATFVDLLPMPEFGIAAKEEYVVADAEEWLKNSTERYDLILSASTIQWFADPIGFLHKVKSHLNPGGFALISTFVKGNLKELDSLRTAPIIYRTAEEYRAIPGIQAEEWERNLTFPSSRELLMHLRLTGVSPRLKKGLVSVGRNVSDESKKRLTELPLHLTYHPMILLINADDPLI
ncbi:MAG: DUF452 family protein [Muribaculaceae bacterium]|nr:DUF452 family protein [Muribaculaceae bacterium]